MENNNIETENNSSNKKNKIILILKELRWFFFFFILIIIFRIYVFDIFKVDGSSMIPTLTDKQFVVVDKINHKDIKRGEIIIFDSRTKKPETIENKTSLTKRISKNYYVKRIIGLPGDIIKIKDGYVYLSKDNGNTFVKLNEKYLNDDNNGNTFVGGIEDTNLIEDKIYKVPEDSYFVLGDNRLNSSDSRSCFNYSCADTEHTPFVSKNDIVGKLALY